MNDGAVNVDRSPVKVAIDFKKLAHVAVLEFFEDSAICSKRLSFILRSGVSLGPLYL